MVISLFSLDFAFVNYLVMVSEENLAAACLQVHYQCCLFTSTLPVLLSVFSGNRPAQVSSNCSPLNFLHNCILFVAAPVSLELVWYKKGHLGCISIRNSSCMSMVGFKFIFVLIQLLHHKKCHEASFLVQGCHFLNTQLS